MLIKIFSLTLLLVCVLPLDVFAENYVCKDNQNKLFIKFDYNNKQVHSANKQIYKYTNNLLSGHSLKHILAGIAVYLIADLLNESNIV